ERRSGNGRHWLCLGHLLKERADRAGAEPALTKAVEALRDTLRRRPGSAIDQSNLGSALSGQGKVDEAIAEYRAAIQLQPDLAPTRYSLGAILCDVKHDYTEAEAEFREVIRLQPDDAMAHYSLGNALLGQGKVDEAIAEYRAAIRLQPDLAQCHTNL